MVSSALRGGWSAEVVRGAAAPGQCAFDHENRKVPISKPTANDQRPNVQAETTRTRSRMSSSCGISWDRSVIAAAPLRWPLGFGENAKTVILAPKKATNGRGGAARRPHFAEGDLSGLKEKKTCIVEPRGRLTVESGRPRSSFQGRGRQGSSAIDAPAGGPSLPMTIKARRFTLAGFVC